MYRWRVNEILDSSELGLRLAESGEDIGRLVRVTNDPRDVLVEHAMAATDPRDHFAIAHAVALFRSRGRRPRGQAQRRGRARQSAGGPPPPAQGRAGEQRRRCAVHIANKFDLRHRDGKQHQRYAEAFLDWIFWWYLATIELTDRLHAEQQASV